MPITLVEFDATFYKCFDIDSNNLAWYQKYKAWSTWALAAWRNIDSGACWNIHRRIRLKIQDILWNCGRTVEATLAAAVFIFTRGRLQARVFKLGRDEIPGRFDARVVLCSVPNNGAGWWGPIKLLRRKEQNRKITKFYWESYLPQPYIAWWYP